MYCQQWGRMLSKASNSFLDSSQAVYNPSNIWTAVDIIPHLYPVVKMEPQRVYNIYLNNRPPEQAEKTTLWPRLHHDINAESDCNISEFSIISV